MAEKIKVLIVDDSATIRAILRDIFEASPFLQVCGEAEDPFIARNLIKKLNPDVITLDIEMPNMDGITFLRNLMRLHPIPTIMLSTLTKKGSWQSADALMCGALDCVHKPSDGDWGKIEDALVEKVIQASSAKVSKLLDGFFEEPVVQNISGRFIPDRIIAIGSSTGGIPAIQEVLSVLPHDCPPVVIVQHLPEYISGSLAHRLNSQITLSVVEAEQGMELKHGVAYIANGGLHLEIIKRAGHFYCHLKDGPEVRFQRPSVDVLFKSLAKVNAGNVSAVILTGMGSDGAEGLLTLKNSGCVTMIQDEATSTVWGMPGAANKLGAADKIYPLSKIGKKLLLSCIGRGGKHVN